MKGFIPYSKHLFLLTKCRTHYFLFSSAECFHPQTLTASKFSFQRGSFFCLFVSMVESTFRIANSARALPPDLTGWNVCHCGKA